MQADSSTTTLVSCPYRTETETETATTRESEPASILSFCLSQALIGRKAADVGFVICIDRFGCFVTLPAQAQRILPIVNALYTAQNMLQPWQIEEL